MKTIEPRYLLPLLLLALSCNPDQREQGRRAELRKNSPHCLYEHTQDELIEPLPQGYVVCGLVAQHNWYTRISCKDTPCPPLLVASH